MRLRARWYAPRLALLVLVVSLFRVAAVDPGRPARAATGLQKIKHIIFIIKENHSFDNYFGAYPGANGATTGVVNVGGGVTRTIPLGAFTDHPPDYAHFRSSAIAAYDNGQMDAFNVGPCSQSPYTCYQVAQRSDLPNYWSYADNFVLDDNGWSDLLGPSFPNHMYTLAAVSGVDVAHSAVDNPSGNNWGCDAATGTTVLLQNGSNVFPCFSGITTLADLMSKSGVTWRYYSPQRGQPGYVWNALDAFSQYHSGGGLGPNDVDPTQFLSDVQGGTLPQFSWLTAPYDYTEHPSSDQSGTNSMCRGENWTVAQINAVMQSSLWSSTLIVLTWDDYGGYYDHVPPQQVDQLGYGMRVPFLVISPYAYAGDDPNNPHISHDYIDFGSVLKLAEETFGLPSLGGRDATAGSLDGLLDTSVVHNAPLVLSQRTCASSTATSTPTATQTNIATGTPTDTPTSTPIATATASPTGMPTDTATATNTPTPTPTGTDTATPTDTPTPSNCHNKHKCG